MAYRKTVLLNELGVVVTKDVDDYFKNIEVVAGILQDSLYKNGSSLQKVAAILEKKYKWIEKGVETHQNDDLKRAIEIVIGGILSGNLSEQQFINAVAATLINPINRREFGSNAPSTIKAKGFDKVMVHTGKFINAIKARINRG